LKTLRLLSVVAAPLLFVGCVELEDPGGGGGGGGLGAPRPAPDPIYQSRWIGTAPFCAARPSDCSNLGAGWEYSGRSNLSGDGATCASGQKVLCRKQIN
jgi:hypothetical protein